MYLVFVPSLAGAQSLEPRLYLPLPTGWNAIVASYSYSYGGVVLDGTLPIEDVNVSTNTGTVAFARAFGLFGRSAQVQAVVPYVKGTVDGTVAGQDTARHLNGLADPQLRLALNLAGGPARRREELAGVRFGTIVGGSLVVTTPLGEYDPDRLVNISAHRFAVKPEVGVIQPMGRGWALEGYAGVWLFGDNTEYHRTSTLSQDPLWTFQAHVVHLFGRRAWLALDGTFVSGGTTSVDGVTQNTFQRNSRFGATGSWFLGGGHAVKGSFSSGVFTRVGGEFDVFAVSYQYGWAD
ncbi:MAG TPA: transporter [Gemmatimonadales bacterium]|nr:transporter [Gemmatimonadales bacterium]